ncbi:MAG: hypothetical protein K0R73_550 [Candidatus Midichloriaceae bacterium]|jgi:hypothetical protein|nr:hypothetical protein [Candidatus Midichloriaceae bacterium]
MKDNVEQKDTKNIIAEAGIDITTTTATTVHDVAVNANPEVPGFMKFMNRGIKGISPVVDGGIRYAENKGKYGVKFNKKHLATQSWDYTMYI